MACCLSRETLLAPLGFSLRDTFSLQEGDLVRSNVCRVLYNIIKQQELWKENVLIFPSIPNHVLIWPKDFHSWDRYQIWKICFEGFAYKCGIIHLCWTRTPEQLYKTLFKMFFRSENKKIKLIDTLMQVFYRISVQRVCPKNFIV